MMTPNDPACSFTILLFYAMWCMGDPSFACPLVVSVIPKNLRSLLHCFSYMSKRSQNKGLLHYSRYVSEILQDNSLICYSGYSLEKCWNLLHYFSYVSKKLQNKSLLCCSGYVLEKSKTRVYSAINVWCKTDWQKEDRGPNEDVGIEGNSGSDGKDKWSEMVRACVEEDGHVLRKALEFEVNGKGKWGWPKKMWKMQGEDALEKHAR